MASSMGSIGNMVFSEYYDSGSGSQGGGSNQGQLPPPKRNRVLLSCHPCRFSKSKCDRAVPCGQCLKKGKPDACAYAPRLEKSKPARSMAARLRRLEGMVRGMAEASKTEGDGTNAPVSSAQAPGGSVVHSEGATNYVGGTHFMAMLEDLEDLKAYFEDPEDSDGDVEDPSEILNAGELLLHTRGGPRNKEELLALLPSKSTMDRLMNRYLNSNSPSQPIIHTPTFAKQYKQFLENKLDTDIHWIATLFMILGLGVFFSTFQAPHELELDSSVPAMDKFRQYRAASGWALIWGKYSQPGPFTIQALLLYTEAEFLTNRVSQTNSYLLCSTLIRLMLKVGLHRDPSKLPCITPYQGELRRRMWNLAVQIDLICSFHLGLPSMIQGIESDTGLPLNLLDSDFNEDSTELPSPRPLTEYTPLSYPINKSKIVQVFGIVARLSHSLTVPSYAEVMRVDSCIQAVWSGVPAFMKAKPLSESILDPPLLVIQRFGLASLYQKSRCVLHRRYLVEPSPLKEHDYSRRTCLEAAVALLEYQSTLFEATKPGALLAQNGWSVACLAINDFLLADMAVALTILQQIEGRGDLEWMANCTPPVTQTSLIQMLKHSYFIWTKMGDTVSSFRKAAAVVRTMLMKIQTQIDAAHTESEMSYGSIPTGASSFDEQISPRARMSLGSIDARSLSQPYHGTSASHYNGPSTHESTSFRVMEPSPAVMEGQYDASDEQQMAAGPWGGSEVQNGYDWNQFDALSRGPSDGGISVPQFSQLEGQDWMDEMNFDDFENFLATNPWNSMPDP